MALAQKTRVLFFDSFHAQGGCLDAKSSCLGINIILPNRVVPRDVRARLGQEIGEGGDERTHWDKDKGALVACLYK